MLKGSPEEEYKELSNNIRFYANMRFAQLTLFSAVTAALLTIVFVREPPLEEAARTVLKIGGGIVTFVFWVMEERSNGYGMHFARRIIELEGLLGYRVWQGRRMGTKAIFSATNAVRLMYFFVAVFWLVTILCGL
jgi:hypothetical protein